MVLNILLCMGIINFNFNQPNPPHRTTEHHLTGAVIKFFDVMTTRTQHRFRQHIPAASNAFNKIIKDGRLDEFPELVLIIIKRIVKPIKSMEPEDLRDVLIELRSKLNDKTKLSVEQLEFLDFANSFVTEDHARNMTAACKLLEKYPLVEKSLEDIWYETIMAYFQPFIDNTESKQFWNFYQEVLNMLETDASITTFKPKVATLNITVTLA